MCVCACDGVCPLRKVRKYVCVHVLYLRVVHGYFFVLSGVAGSRSPKIGVTKFWSVSSKITSLQHSHGKLTSSYNSFVKLRPWRKMVNWQVLLLVFLDNCAICFKSDTGLVEHLGSDSCNVNQKTLHQSAFQEISACHDFDTFSVFVFILFPPKVSLYDDERCCDSPVVVVVVVHPDLEIPRC